MHTRVFTQQAKEWSQIIENEFELEAADLAKWKELLEAVMCNGDEIEDVLYATYCVMELHSLRMRVRLRSTSAVQSSSPISTKRRR